MRKIYYSFGLVLIALALITLDSNAQTRYVDVDPGIGTLNDSISGDTTDLGERIDPDNTVYRLKRGIEAYYGLTGSLENSGYPLTIVAEDGDGARPFLQPRVVGDGSSRAFRPKGDVTLMGLHVTNMDDLGGLNTRILRCSRDSISVVLDNCWFDKDGQSFIRCDNPGLIIKVTNSVISNIGHPTSPNNGRGIDDRGNAIDTVIFENCTFYNITSRIIRDAGGAINYVRMNNNTMVNIGQMGITFGPTGMLELKNNIAVNAGFLPKDDDNNWIVFSVDSVGDVAPVVDMTNNTAYLDSAKLVPFLNDTTTITPFMNPTLMAALIAAGDEDANWNMNIEFTDGTPFNDSMLIYYNDPAFDVANTPYWDIPDIPGVGEGGNGLYHLDVPYDYGYVHSKAFIASTDGMQLGDRNWMADRGVMGLIDFEDPSDRPFWVPFANAGDAPENLAIVANPDNSGINTSAAVMMYSVQAGADPWAGAFSDANGYMEFTTEMHHMEMMVYKDVISNCGLKVEVGGTVTEVKVPNTVTNEWELLTFDFSANVGEILTRIVFFPDFPDTRDAGSTAYVDNIQIILSPVGVETSEGLTLKVYPNPASDHMIIQYQGMTHIVVRDLLGKSVKSIQLQGEDYTTIEVDDLSEGIYFITVGSEGSSATTKFLKR